MPYTPQPQMSQSQYSPLEQRIGMPKRQYPFEMRFVEQNLGSEGEIVWGRAEVYLNDKIRAYFSFFDGYSERRLTEDAEDILKGRETKIRLVTCGCIHSFVSSTSLSFTRTDGNKVTVQLDKYDKPSLTEPVELGVTLYSEEAAYQLARFLNNWYKHLLQRETSPETKRWHSDNKTKVLRLFHNPKIQQQFEQDGIEIYNFENIPNRTEIETVTVPQEDLERLLESLENELGEHLKQKTPPISTIDGYEYDYVLKDGNVVNIRIKSDSEGKKEIEIEMPDEREEDEYIFDIVANKWEKKERLGWTTRY